MDNDLLISLLTTKLAEASRQANEHRQLARLHAQKEAQFTALAENINATIEGLVQQESSVSQQPEIETSFALSKSSEEVALVPCGVDEEIQDSSEPSLEGYRSPKDMKRSEFGKKGYVQIAEQILDKHHSGLTIDQLVNMVFDTHSPEEFERAKGSFSAEINRGVRENRLKKNEETEKFYHTRIEFCHTGIGSITALDDSTLHSNGLSNLNQEKQYDEA